MAKTDAQPPRWSRRALVVLVIAPVLLWCVLYRTWREVRGIPQYIWCDWCDCLAEAAEIWRTGELRKEEEW